MRRPASLLVQWVLWQSENDAMKTETMKWIEAGKLISNDANARVECPRCGRAILEVHDVPVDADPAAFERYMTCHACGGRNVLRMKRGGEENPPVAKTPVRVGENRS